MHLILDVEICEAVALELRAMGFCLHPFRDMAQSLVEREEWNRFYPDKTLLVFVGNGGNKVRNCLPCEWMSCWLWKADAFAKRFWEPGGYPDAIANRFARGVYVGISDVVLVDDVVTSGITARRVREANALWVPNACWHVATLIAQKSASLRGYRSSFSVTQIGTTKHKVPVNSLSALIIDSEMATIYAERNLDRKAPTFLEIIDRLKCQ